MKILPIGNRYKNYSPKTKTSHDRYDAEGALAFKSKLSYSTISKISRNFTSFIRKYNSQPLNKFSSNELMTIMALEGTVAPIGFFTLSEKVPLIAKSLLNHDRVSEVNDSIMSKILDLNYEDGVTVEQAEAFVNLLDIHYKDEIPLFTIQEALENAIYLSEHNRINNNSEELKLIFSSLDRTGAGFLDCLSCAIALENGQKDLTPEELIAYYSTFPEAEDEYVVTWASLNKENRFDMLMLLNESEFIIDVCNRNFDELVPDEQLLRRLKFLEEHKEEFYKIFTNIPFPSDLLGTFYSENSIKKSLEMLTSLSKEALEYCSENRAVYQLFDFELSPFRKESTSGASFDDLKTFVEILAQYDIENCIDLSLESLSYVPVMSKNVQETLITNLMKSYKYFEDTSNLMINKILVKNLFNADLEKNYLTFQNLSSEKLLSELSLKCKNRNPEFIKIAKEFLENTPSLDAYFSDIPGISSEMLIDSLFAISKLQIASLYKLDKNLINQKLVDKYISLLPKDERGATTFERTYIDRDFHSDLIAVKSAYYKFTDPYLMLKLLNLVSVTDSEYANLLLDKGFENLIRKSDDLSNLPYKTKILVQNIFKHAKNLDSNNDIIKLSGKQKMTLITLVSKYHGLLGEKLNEILEDSIVKRIPKTNDYILDYENFRTQTYINLLKVLTGNDIDKAELGNWDLDYFYLVANPKSNDEGELMLAVDLLSQKSLFDYITDQSTPYGKNNSNTECSFNLFDLNYDRWLKGIPSEKIWANGREYTIELFDRNEPNNLFMGNYTNCCTSLDGTHSESVPNYILNTAFNVFLVKDFSGKIIATSRVFAAEIDSKPALVIDNIEASNDFTRKLNPEKEAAFGQDVWNYIIKFADSLSNNKIPVYMTSFCQKISLPEVQSSNKRFKIIGDIKKDFLYVNSLAKVVDPRNEMRSNFLLVRESQ